MSVMRPRGLPWLTLLAPLALLGCDDAVTGAPAADAARPDAAPPDASPDAAPPAPDAGPAPPASPYAVRVVTLRPDPVPLDLLWIIEDAGSMCGEQFTVPDAVAGFVDALLDAAPDLDLAMTTALTDTDAVRGLDGRFVAAPAISVPTPGCIDPRNGLPYVPPTDECEARAAAGQLPAIVTWGGDGVGEVGADCPDAACKRGWLRFAAHCLTTVGVRGSDFPAGIAALVRATACDGPNKDLLGHCCGPEDDPGCARMWRPGAARAVVVIADGDDCSAPPDFLRDTPDRCAWQAGDLDPVPTAVDHLRETGAEPLGVFVWTAPDAVTADGAGARWRAYDPDRDPPECDPAADPEADFAAWRDRCCPPGEACVGPPRDTCSILARDGAAATPRYRELARALGTGAGPEPITVCDPTVGPALAERVAAFAHPRRRLCLGPVDGPLIVSARCVEGDRLPGARCDGPWAPLVDVDLRVDDPSCDGVAIELPPGTGPGAEIRVEHRAPMPAGEPAETCGLPRGCSEVRPARGDGFAIEYGWRCAAPGQGCGGGWCVGRPGELPHCTVECRSPDDCPIGRCVAVHPEGCAAAGGGCVCAM